MAEIARLLDQAEVEAAAGGGVTPAASDEHAADAAEVQGFRGRLEWTTQQAQAATNSFISAGRDHVAAFEDKTSKQGLNFEYSLVPFYFSALCLFHVPARSAPLPPRHAPGSTGGRAGSVDALLDGHPRPATAQRPSHQEGETKKVPLTLLCKGGK